MIYLATPYIDPDPAVMEDRFHRACIVAGRFMSQGIVVFCPIAYTHPIAVRCELPRHWRYWELFDYDFLAASEKLIVVMMPGWEQSRGIAGEIAIAKELGIPIEYIEEN